MTMNKTVDVKNLIQKDSSLLKNTTSITSMQKSSINKEILTKKDLDPKKVLSKELLKVPSKAPKKSFSPDTREDSVSSSFDTLINLIDRIANKAFSKLDRERKYLARVYLCNYFSLHKDVLTQLLSRDTDTVESALSVVRNLTNIVMDALSTDEFFRMRSQVDYVQYKTMNDLKEFAKTHQDLISEYTKDAVTSDTAMKDVYMFKGPSDTVRKVVIQGE